MKKSSLLLSLVTLCSCQGVPPKNLGLQQVKETSDKMKMSLAPCPDKPNCVTSFKWPNDDDHYMDAIEISSNKERAYKKILGIISKMPRTKIVKQEDNYIHVEFTSGLMKFVDDVEFYFGEPGLVHFRSASRKGYSDLGVNKKRMGEIIFKFHQNDF